MPSQQSSAAEKTGKTNRVSHQFQFDPASRLLLCRIEGVVTDESIREYYRDVRRYAEKIQPSAGIVDFTGVTSFRASAATIRDLANSPPPLKDPKVPRFIVAPTDHIFAMARMFELQGDTTRPLLQVVRTLRDAYALLDIRDPRLEPVGPAGDEQL